MYVCVCKAVSDRELRRLAEGGCRSVRDVCRNTGAGSGCGKCVPEIRGLLTEHAMATTVGISNAALDGVSGIAA